MKASFVEFTGSQEDYYDLGMCPLEEDDDVFEFRSGGLRFDDLTCKKL